MIIDRKVEIMRFAIRDDDTCYFTHPKELETAYDFINEKDVLTLSIVPNTVPIHKKGNRPYGIYDFKEYDIEGNHELLEYLKKGVNEGKIDPLLHGYSHEYKCDNDNWFSEMEWKDENRLHFEISNGKARLERALNTNITVFVPPSNHIGKKGIRVLEKNQLNLSGIIQFNDRTISVKYIINFLKRWSIRLFKGIQYGGILDYGKHKELCAYATDSLERMIVEYNYCKKHNYPFVIYTHYWSMNKNPNEKEKVKQIYEYVKRDGAEMVGLSMFFK